MAVKKIFFSFRILLNSHAIYDPKDKITIQNLRLAFKNSSIFLKIIPKIFIIFIAGRNLLNQINILYVYRIEVITLINLNIYDVSEAGKS